MLWRSTSFWQLNMGQKGEVKYISFYCSARHKGATKCSAGTAKLQGIMFLFAWSWALNVYYSYLHTLFLHKSFGVHLIRGCVHFVPPYKKLMVKVKRMSITDQLHPSRSPDGPQEHLKIDVKFKWKPSENKPCVAHQQKPLIMSTCQLFVPWI